MPCGGCRTEPIVTVLASRPEGTVGLPQGLLSMIDTGGLRLDLHPLSVDEVRELAGLYGHRDVNERAARRLREHTGEIRCTCGLCSRRAGFRAAGWLSAPLPAPRPFARLVAAQLERLDAARARPGESGGRARSALRSLRRGRDGRGDGSARGRGPAPYGTDRRCGAEGRAGLELVFDHSVIRAAVLQDCGEADLAAFIALPPR